jgi:chromosome segregation ATPase
MARPPALVKQKIAHWQERIARYNERYVELEKLKSSKKMGVPHIRLKTEQELQLIVSIKGAMVKRVWALYEELASLQKSSTSPPQPTFEIVKAPVEKACDREKRQITNKFRVKKVAIAKEKTQIEMLQESVKATVKVEESLRRDIDSRKEETASLYSKWKEYDHRLVVLNEEGSGIPAKIRYIYKQIRRNDMRIEELEKEIQEAKRSAGEKEKAIEKSKEKLAALYREWKVISGMYSSMKWKK